MGWVVLILGVGLWWSAHLFKRIAPERRAALGDKGKGIVALALLASIVLMVIGYKGTGFVNIWIPPSFLTHINNLLVLIAIYMMSPAPKKGRLLAGMRHPMLTGFALWAIAHLLVNGDLASIILFGGLLAWVPVTIAKINAAEPDWTPARRRNLWQRCHVLRRLDRSDGDHWLYSLFGRPLAVWIMSTLYRFLSADDTSEFCHKVTAALNSGWILHGSPTYAFDAANGVMRCGQAVTKQVETDYTPDMKLGEQ